MSVLRALDTIYRFTDCTNYCSCRDNSVPSGYIGSCLLPARMLSSYYHLSDGALKAGNQGRIWRVSRDSLKRCKNTKALVLPDERAVTVTRVTLHRRD